MVGHKNSLKIKKCEDNTHTTYHRSQTHIHTFLSHSRRPRDYFYILSGMTNQDREGQRRTDLGQKSQFDVEKTHSERGLFCRKSDAPALHAVRSMFQAGDMSICGNPRSSIGHIDMLADNVKRATRLHVAPNTTRKSDIVRYVV